MSAIDIITPPPVTAPGGASAGATGQGGAEQTGFAALVAVSTGEGGEPSEAAEAGAASATTNAMAGLLTGAATLMQVPAVATIAAPTEAVAGAGAAATTPAAIGGDPASPTLSPVPAPAPATGAEPAGDAPTAAAGQLPTASVPAGASTQTAPGVQPPPTAQTVQTAQAAPGVQATAPAAPGVEAATPAQPHPAMPTTQAASPAPPANAAQATQAVASALAQAGLAPDGADIPPEAESGLARLQGLIQDGARRAGLRDGSAPAKPGAAGAAGPAASAVTSSTPPAVTGTPASPSSPAPALSDSVVRPDAGQANAALLEPAPEAAAVPAEVGPDSQPTLERANATMLREAGSGLSRATIETTAQIAAQILRRLEGRSTRFEMALTPEGLGRVDVSLDIDSDGRLAARLAFDNPAAATDLRGRADELRRQLQDAGFQLAGDALDFSQRDQSNGERFDRRPSRAFAGAVRLHAETDAVAATPSRWQSLTLTPEGVDMKV